MPEIIGLGGDRDRSSIDLQTAKRRRIPNVQLSQRTPEEMMAARQIATGGSTRREMRSLSATYNCVGMVFGNRRTAIEPEHVPMILRDDGYVEVDREENVTIGDVIVYEDEATGEVLHVGWVVANHLAIEGGSVRKIRILSQFGRDGEYFHDHTDVPSMYGRKFRFYSESRRVEPSCLLLTS